MSNVCQICDYKTNLTARKSISCPFCSFDVCRTCCETYVTNEALIKCMNPSCGREWTRQFSRTAFTATFLNKKYKEVREQTLFDQERALLPATQPIVENMIRVENVRVQMADVNRQIRELYERQRELQGELYAGQRANVTTTSERHEFIKSCPDGNCRGFLSSQWKCGICEKWACNACHEIKGDTRDAEHTCNPETVATVALLQNDTRPCPKCRTGIFKIDGCFAKDTPVLMWDGSKKMSQDIIVGDVLIGDDGCQRVVERLVSGEDSLYEIQQSNGINYTVNSKHTLVLKFTGNNSVHWVESINSWKIIWFDIQKKCMKSKSFKVTNAYDKDAAKQDADVYLRQLNLNDIIHLTVEDYLELDKSSKNNLFGFKSSAGINYPNQTVSLDPYILGLWLGDGTHTQPVIASNDIEIREYINSWCVNNDAELVKEGNYKYRIRRKGNFLGRETVDGVVYEEKSSNLDKSNPFTNLLKQYNILGNKHIPKEFMMNSRENRLKLLAGIIDTDGHVPKDQQGKRVVIIQSHEILSKQIILLAQSLGFVVNYRMRERKNVVIFNTDAKDYKDQYVINISGENLCDIPTILPRKKCVGTASNKDYFRTGIEVTPIGRGQYFGWSVNENKRFLLTDFTVVRNCDQMWCTQCHTAFNWRNGRIENVVHNPHYFEWLRRNGNDVPRNPGDIPCRNELTHNDFRDIRNIIITRHKDHPLSTACLNFLQQAIQNAIHLRWVIQERYRQVDYVERNQSLRVSYMRNQITEEQFKISLQRNEKKNEKSREVRNVLDILFTTVTDIIFRFRAHLNTAPANKWEGTILEELDVIVDYVNECLADISHTYTSKKIVFYNDIRMR